MIITIRHYERDRLRSGIGQCDKIHTDGTIRQVKAKAKAMLRSYTNAPFRDWYTFPTGEIHIIAGDYSAMITE